MVWMYEETFNYPTKLRFNYPTEDKIEFELWAYGFLVFENKMIRFYIIR